MFTIVFVLIFGAFIMTVINSIRRWNKNNYSPRLSVGAIVVSKRINVTHHHHANAGDMTGAHGFHTSSHTNYYVTFQVASGDRMEFLVDGREYGMLAEGDRGILNFQGTRYLGFENMPS
jgi:hypothetical protein